MVAGKAVAGLAIVCLNAFFVAAEFALVRVRDTQLQPLAERGSRRAAMARHIIRNMDAYLSTMQLGITLCGLGMGALVEPLFGELLSPVFHALRVESEDVRETASFVVGFLVNAFVLIAIGELAPKSIALRKTLPVSVVVAHPLWLLYWAFFPFIWALNGTSQWFLRRLGFGSPEDSLQGHSEEELRLMLSGAAHGAGRGSASRDLALNALDLRWRQAREVMQPRPEIVVFDTEATLEECLRLAEDTRYSRFPLCEGGDLDRTLGVVHIKDLYGLRGRARTGSDLKRVMRPLVYIPETARLERVLERLQERRLHLAMVVDEYGGTVGLVTLENILEELVGQIQDEFDQEKPLQVQVDENTWELAGNLPLHELSQLVGEPLQSPGVSSASGWITQRLGGFPMQGDTVPLGRYALRVDETHGARVTRLRLIRSAGSGPAPGRGSGSGSVTEGNSEPGSGSGSGPAGGSSDGEGGS